MEFSRRNTAERYAVYILFDSRFETSAVALPKRVYVIIAEISLNDRSDRVNDVFAREIVSICDFSPPDRLGIALPPHYIVAFKAELHARKGVDSVVNTAVAGAVTACQPRVRRVHYRAAFKRGDVALPQADMRLDCRNRLVVGNAFPRNFAAQQLVLNADKIFVNRLSLADIHETSEQIEAPIFVIRQRNVGQIVPFRQKSVNKISKLFALHGGFLPPKRHLLFVI